MAKQRKESLISPSDSAREADRLSPDQLLQAIIATLEDRLAEDAVVISLSGKSTIADYMVVASGRSSRQVAALAETLVQKLKDLGMKGLRPEGMGQADWVLIDAGDVIVHLFRPEVRAFYNLEKMWDVAIPEPDRSTSGAGG